MSAAPDAATPVVSAFYDRFPYPGDPLQDGPPPAPPRQEVLLEEIRNLLAKQS